jgi:hypothetical protein
MKTNELEYAIAKYFNWGVNIIVSNVGIGMGLHECDVLVMSKSGYLTEIELKVSKADLLKDKDKWHKHENKKIKYLYFAVPIELKDIALTSIPTRAGLMVADIYRKKIRITIVKNPIPNSNPVKLGIEDKLKLLRLAHMRVWNLKYKLLKAK